MIEYAQGGLILDEPTYENIARVLEMMTLRPCKAMRLLDPTLAGTELCGYNVTLEMAIVFYGDTTTLEEESMIVNPDHVQRMARGETIRYRVERYNHAMVKLDKDAHSEVAFPLSTDYRPLVQTGVLLPRLYQSSYNLQFLGTSEQKASLS